MATFPEGNPGVFPVDPESEVGQFRILVGDTTAEPYDPAEPGIRNYRMFSDSEIEGYLITNPDSLYRAVGFAYLALASQAAIESKNVKDYDLSVNTEKRAEHLRQIAQDWFNRAEEEDSGSGASAYFDVVPTGTSHRHRDELAEGLWLGHGY